MARLYLNTVQLFLQSAGPATITPPYTVEVTNAEYGQVTGAWNWEVSRCPQLEDAYECRGIRNVRLALSPMYLLRRASQDGS